MTSIKTTRLMKELKDLKDCRPVVDNRLDILETEVCGEQGTPYENGRFTLRIEIPDRYPFEPPRVRFLTKIYHPNIDKEGRICLEILKTTSKSSWKPTFNISTVLGAIRLLMAEPNPDDPLEETIAEELLLDKERYLATARRWTEKYASGTAQNVSQSGTSDSGKDSSAEDTSAAGKSPESVTSTFRHLPSSDGKPGSSADSGSRLRSLFSSKARSADALSRKAFPNELSSPAQTVAVGESTKTSDYESAVTTTKKVLASSQEVAPALAKESSSTGETPTAASTPTKGSQTTSQSSSCKKSATKVGGKPKTVEKRPKAATPKSNNPTKKPNSGDGKRENAALARRQKRPRFEDLYLDNDDDFELI